MLESFKQCRLLSYEEANTLARQTDQFYVDWIQKTINRYGYKTRRELFMNMKSCIIEQHETDLIFLPSHYEELEMWVGHTVEHENNIKISVNSPAAKIGATLRLTFSCCTG